MGSIGADATTNGSSNHHQAIVVGAGPVGLLTAINLARLGIKTCVVERGPGIDQSPRATSYQPCVMAEMLESGILDDVKRKSVINNILSYWEGRGPEKKRLAFVEKLEGGDRFPAGINCGQPILTETIYEHLKGRYPNCQVIFNQKLEALEQTENEVKIVCSDAMKGSESTYTTDWLIGADGAGSATRRLLGIPFDGFSWPKEDFCASNIRYPFHKYGFTTANFVTDPVHWAVVTIIDGTGLWRCAFGVKPGMTNDEIREELDDHYKHIFPGWPGDGYELVQLNRYKPHQRCAGQFRKGRCFLAGDAAHSNNPIGGLGLTTGLLDAGPLGRALGAVINGRAPSDILNTWAADRRDKWLNFTNPFSIENKRLMQRGGYSDDPKGIWKQDEISEEHGMDEYIKSAKPEKREEDNEFFEALKDVERQKAARMKQWDITMDPLWMSEYEDVEVVKLRMSLRPLVPTLAET